MSRGKKVELQVLDHIDNTGILAFYVNGVKQTLHIAKTLYTGSNNEKADIIVNTVADGEVGISLKAKGQGIGKSSVMNHQNRRNLANNILPVLYGKDLQDLVLAKLDKFFADGVNRKVLEVFSAEEILPLISWYCFEGAGKGKSYQPADVMIMVKDVNGVNTAFTRENIEKLLPYLEMERNATRYKTDLEGNWGHTLQIRINFS